VLLLHGQWSIVSVRAHGHESDRPVGERRKQKGLIIAQRDIAVRSSGAAVEHHNGGTAGRRLAEGCRHAVWAD
jgi:hypothetical protein